MACKKFDIRDLIPINQIGMINSQQKQDKNDPNFVEKLFFGVDTKTTAHNLLQNNLNQMEWVVRNKQYPFFWGRYINGENAVTKEEIDFIRSVACRVAIICKVEKSGEETKTEKQGLAFAKSIALMADVLGLPSHTAIFLEIDENENIPTNYLRGFAKGLLVASFTPGFKANTDAKFTFDREFSRGMQSHKDIFEKCMIWATAPVFPEYDHMTTTHLIHPDYWKPFAPSGTTRKNIAVWQYGCECHPIEDDFGSKTSFNLNLVKDVEVLKKML